MLHFTAFAGWRGSFDSSSEIRLLQWRSRQAQGKTGFILLAVFRLEQQPASSS